MDLILIDHILPEKKKKMGTEESKMTLREKQCLYWEWWCYKDAIAPIFLHRLHCNGFVKSGLFGELGSQFLFLFSHEITNFCLKKKEKINKIFNAFSFSKELNYGCFFLILLFNMNPLPEYSFSLFKLELIGWIFNKTKFYLYKVVS